MIITNLYTATAIQEHKLRFSKKYLAECRDYIINSPDKQSRSTNVEGSMTSWKLWLETPLFAHLISDIVKIANAVPLVSRPVQTKVEERSYNLLDLWGAYYQEGEGCRKHDHVSSLFSFVFYFDGEETSTHIHFDTFPPKSYAPEANKLLLFPSYLAHWVPKCKKGEHRVCLAGNFGWQVNEKKDKQ